MKSHKAVVIRPGALGDVLVVMPTLRLLKNDIGCTRLVLLAPGERGRFLCREGWADEVHDWDSALFAPLFQGTGQPLPERLPEIFHDADLVISFAGIGDADADATLAAQLHKAAPQAHILAGQAAPPSPGESIRLSLYKAARAFCAEHGISAPSDAEACLSAPITVPPLPDGLPAHPYLAVHPGSGGRRKNWPIENFIALSHSLLALRQNGTPVFSGLAVTAGEADGDLGERLAASVPGAVLYRNRPLEDVASVLAHATLYIGNDSGVSHLAGSVATAEGKRPKVAVFFGATPSRVWSPYKAKILPLAADAGTVIEKIKGFEMPPDAF